MTSDLCASLKTKSCIIIKRSALPIAVVTVNYPFFPRPSLSANTHPLQQVGRGGPGSSQILNQELGPVRVLLLDGCRNTQT